MRVHDAPKSEKKATKIYTSKYIIAEKVSKTGTGDGYTPTHKKKSVDVKKITAKMSTL